MTRGFLAFVLSRVIERKKDLHLRGLRELTNKMHRDQLAENKEYKWLLLLILAPLLFSKFSKKF